MLEAVKAPTRWSSRTSEGAEGTDGGACRSWQESNNPFAGLGSQPLGVPGVYFFFLPGCLARDLHIQVLFTCYLGPLTCNKPPLWVPFDPPFSAAGSCWLEVATDDCRVKSGAPGGSPEGVTGDQGLTGLLSLLSSFAVSQKPLVTSRLTADLVSISQAPKVHTAISYF